jgi:hypothetical protein
MLRQARPSVEEAVRKSEVIKFCVAHLTRVPVNLRLSKRQVDYTQPCEKLSRIIRQFIG